MIDYRTPKTYVAGHCGLVGSAIVRRLRPEAAGNLVVRTSQELDLRDLPRVEEFFAAERPDYVFLAAARVGGIKANMTSPADFILDNIRIESNVILCCVKFGVKKLLFLGSCCIYPTAAAQPLQESSLMTGRVEPTNKAFALAKLAGIEMCDASFRQHDLQSVCAIPAGVYGPNDLFDSERSHVIPAMLLKLHRAKQTGRPVEFWGSGSPRREFLYADDLADALVLTMEQFQDAEVVNIGAGKDIAIRELAALLCEIVAYEGEIVWDISKPDGSSGKLLDTSKLTSLGWAPQQSIRDGLKETYAWCLANHPAFKGPY